MSQTNLKNNLDKFLFKWSNLTSLGVPSSSIGSVFDNERVYKHSPRRFNFYMQVMESIANPNPKILETVIKKENQTRFQRENINEKIKNIVQYFQRPEAKLDPLLIQKIKGALAGNMLTRNIDVKPLGTPIPISADQINILVKALDDYNTYFVDTTKITLRPVPPLSPFTRVPSDRILTTLTKFKDFLLAAKIGDNSRDYMYWNLVSKTIEYPTKDTIEKVYETAREIADFYSKEGEKAAAAGASTPYTDPRPEVLRKQKIGGRVTKANLDAHAAWFAKQAEFWKSLGSIQGGGSPSVEPEMVGGTLLEDMSQRLFNNTQGNVTQQFKDLVANPSPTVTPEQVISTYRNDPYLSPDNEKVAWADRAIFAGLTYIIRALALFLTEWSIYSGYITKFTEAFAMYFGMYVCIFLLVVFLTNARKEDMVFRMIFFYMNSQSEDGKGVWRIIVHLICILMLLPIPYIVKEYREFDQPPVLSFADKATILSGVEKFSLYTWILTSAVALNV